MIEAKVESYCKEDIEYIEAFAKKHNLTIDTTLQQAQVQEVLAGRAAERKGKVTVEGGLDV